MKTTAKQSTPGHVTPRNVPARWKALSTWFPNMMTQELGERRDRLGDVLLVKRVAS